LQNNKTLHIQVASVVSPLPSHKRPLNSYQPPVQKEVVQVVNQQVPQAPFDQAHQRKLLPNQKYSKQSDWQKEQNEEEDVTWAVEEEEEATKKRQKKEEDDDNANREVSNQIEAEEENRLNRDIANAVAHELKLRIGTLPTKMSPVQVIRHGHHLQILEDDQIEPNKKIHDICMAELRNKYFLEVTDIKGLKFTSVVNPIRHFFPPMKLYSSELCRVLGEYKWCGMLEDAKIIRDHNSVIRKLLKK